MGLVRVEFPTQRILSPILIIMMIAGPCQTTSDHVRFLEERNKRDHLKLRILHAIEEINGLRDLHDATSSVTL